MEGRRKLVAVEEAVVAVATAEKGSDQEALPGADLCHCL